MQHLSVRIAWHDSGWNGTVCLRPSSNPYCLDLDRIRKGRDDPAEDRIAGQAFADLAPDRQPPCIAESGAFMNPMTWFRRFEHPYAGLPDTRHSHGHLRPTMVKVPPYSTFAVPFAWMLRGNAEKIEQRLPDQLPPDDEPPFPSPWVFRADRQRQLTDAIFRQIAPGRSLVLFYTKSGHPLGDHINRLVIGIGHISNLGGIIEYDTAPGGPTYPMWDRLVSHSIRPDGANGLLLPYHDYLRPTGDREEDARRRDLLSQITVVPDHGQIMQFSYGSEAVSSDVALTVLERALAVVRAVKGHGVAPGPWTQREQWLNDRIADTWADRGAFPGAAAVLEALGLRLATSMLLELARDGRLRSAADPWPLLDALIRGSEPPPRPAYAADVATFARTWAALPEPRRDFVRLLSRFAIDTEAARRWLEPGKRDDSTLRAVSDQDVLANPYLIPMLDIGGSDGVCVSLRTVDRGLLPDAQIAVAAPLPEPSRVASPSDPRRVEAALVSVLRTAADNGDALLAVDDAIAAAEDLGLTPDLRVSSDWINAHVGDGHPVLRLVTDAPDEGAVAGPRCLQLADLADRGRKLAKILDARTAAPLRSLGEDWRHLLVEAIRRGGGKVDEDNEKHVSALTEQAEALERITTRKASVLVGRAGTGKTSVIGALLASPRLHADGLLLLAPTGKATVQLRRRVPGAPAQNIAQFLYGLGRYDGLRQRVRFGQFQLDRRLSKGWYRRHRERLFCRRARQQRARRRRHGRNSAKWNSD